MRRVALALLLLAEATAAAEVPSFSGDIAPVLRARCAACHMTGTEAGNIALGPDEAWESLVGVKSPTTGLVRVVPGDADSSYLMMKLRGSGLDGQGSGMRMPPGAAPLPEETIRRVTDWIEAGAPRN